MKYKFERRPFLFLAISMMAGIITAYILILIKLTFILKLFIMLLIIVIIIIFIKIIFYTNTSIIKKIIILALPLFLLTGLVRYLHVEYTFSSSYVKHYSKAMHNHVNVKGYLLKDLGDISGDYFYLKAEKINNKKADDIKIQIPKRDFIYLKHNSLISCDLILSEPPVKLNPGGFSYKNYLKKKHIYFQSWEIKNIKLIRQKFSAKSYLIKIKIKIIEVIDRLFSKRLKKFLNAILLGEKAGLDYETELLLREAGASHLLALSGLHAGIIILSLKLICSRVIVNRKISLILISLTSLFYVIFVGASVSIIRASFLTLIFLWSKAFYRDGDFINILSLTLIINLLINPYSLFTVSLQLSYLIVLSIYLLTDFLNKIFPNIISISLSAQLGAFAISAYYFNKYAYIGIITNLWLIPLIAILLPFSFFIIILAITFPPAAVIMVPLLEFAFYIMFKGLELMSFIQGDMLVLAEPNIIYVILYYIILFSIPYLFKKRIILLKAKKYKKLQYISAVLFVIIFSLFFLKFNSGLLEVNFLAVGQGDGIYIKFPNNENMLIDTGPPGNNGRQVEHNIISFLNYKGVKKIDYLIITHFDSDHSGGLKHLLERKKVKNILISEHKEEPLINYLENAAESKKHIELFYISEQNNFKIEECYLNFLNPPKNKVFKDKNENSIVFNLGYGKYTFLFTGDLSKEGENRILDKNKINNINVLKLGHHGSRTSTGNRLLDECRPDLAVISVGKNNYGHPAGEVLDKLKQRNIRFLRTDKNGAVIIRTDGNKINFETYVN
jgi:competence protein ComEC